MNTLVLPATPEPTTPALSAERLAFVLHGMFDLPFDEIASIVGRSPDATR